MIRPADLRGASPRDLLAGYEAHTTHLVAARYGLADVPRSTGRLRCDALDVLATGQALTDAVLATRWVTVFDALAYGAPLAEVAAAMGLDVDEVRAGAASWLDGQMREGLCDEDLYTRLRAHLAYPTADDAVGR